MTIIYLEIYFMLIYNYRRVYKPYVESYNNKGDVIVKNKLYGDGIHDDFPAIQEMLDSKAACVNLPAPDINYLISKTIRIHSNQELRLDRFAKIKLADNANCAMLKNAEPLEMNENIKISGGIWDMNHNNQKYNPWHFADENTGKNAFDELLDRGFHRAYLPIPEGYENKVKLVGRDFPDDVYTGFCFMFNSVKNLYIGNLTIENPVVYGMDLYYIEDFTIENIDFEYNEGSPKLWNLDGVHVEGFCKNGVIRNLKGACHDDTVALTSDDNYLNGPIENITIDGIYAQNSHSAVRLLSRVNPVKNIHITNIYGTFYVYCINIGKYSKLPERSGFENITVDNVFASIGEGTKDVPGNYEPLISIKEDIDIKNLNFSKIYRNETRCANPTIGIKKGTTINNFSISDCVQTNETGKEFEFLHCEGSIKNLCISNVQTGGDKIVNDDANIV